MYPTYVIAGQLQRDILLPLYDAPLVDVPGGDMLYAAAGLLTWDKAIGLLARVGEDYPRQWLELFKRLGLNTQGILILPESMDLRNFLAYSTDFRPQRINPLAHFSRLGLPFPKILLGYQQKSDQSSISPSIPRPVDIPDDYLHAHGVHLCKMDHILANRLVSTFRDAGVTSLTIEPQTDWMVPANWNQVNLLLNGITAFIPSEVELRTFFRGKSNDLIEMAEAITTQSCELVVVKCGAHGQLLVDGNSHKHYQIPAYPVELRDPTGAGAAFCGGFLAGFHKTFDPVQAVLYGNISASITIEGSGAFHSFDAHPDLAKTRLEALKDSVREL
jgi:hypothetical protein